MKTTVVFGTLLLTAALAPASASAAKTCLDVYYQCLNDTWNTSGIVRALADAECGLRYAGCLLNIVK